MKRYILITMLILLTVTLTAQDLSGVKICIDPGHGGHESDDRYIEATGFWESESNLTKGLFLMGLLRSLGATVYITRTGNDDDPPAEDYGTTDDPSLSERVGMANHYNVDYFISIHTNGYNGTANYTMEIFNGYTDNPTNPNSKVMADILKEKVYAVDYTTSTRSIGDLTLNPTWSYGYGVLYPATMPANISEGSFHDYIPESWRLMNESYRKHESWAIARSMLEYFNAGEFGVGNIAGVVRNAEYTVSYYSLTTADSKVPVNDVTVTLLPEGKVYSGDEYNNGYFMFDSLAPGDYELVIAAPLYKSDTVAVTVTANESVFKDVYLTPGANFNFPPVAPEYIRALAVSDSSVVIRCQAVSNAQSYVVYYRTDGVDEPDSVVSSSNEILISGLDNLTAYFFQIKAVNEAGSSSLNTKCYAAVPSANPREILIVNGFDRSTNTRYDYVKEYVQPLISAGCGFSYILNESVINGKIRLSDYETVIWILGDESTADETLSNIEQDSVEYFLKNGGKLFISGSEIGWDLEAKGTAADISFYQNYLKADYINDAPDGAGGTSARYYTATAVTGEIFEGLSDFNFDDGTHGTYDVDWPDAIKGINGGVNILKYLGATTSNIAGIRYEGLFPGGKTEGKLVYLAIPFETVYAEQERIDLMVKIIEYFHSPFNALDEEPVFAKKFELYQNYPNPFNPTTSISFNISEKTNVRLDIFNIRGELVRTLINDQYSSGYWTKIWDSRNDQGSMVPSGMYVYRMKTDSGILTKRMMLLK